MTAIGFLTELQKIGVELIAAADGLRYRAPEGVVTHALREELIRRREEILSLMNRAQLKSLGKRRLSVEIRSLSAAQERLWFMDQLVPSSALYVETVVVSLVGKLNLAALNQSLNEVVGRHESLRTFFQTEHGQPHGCVASALWLDLPSIDLSGLRSEIRSQRARELSLEQACKPFNLGQLPLLRPRLISLDAREHLLVLSLHHIICDGWSKAILAWELSRLYGSFSGSAASDLPGPELQYSDFALWERERLSSGELDHEMEYWREQLGPSVPVIDLPTDRDRPAIRSYRGATIRFELSRSVSEAVRRLSRSRAATTYTTLLAAFQALLSRYCGQEELVVGTIVANRAAAELENIIGLMVNTLVIKGDLSANPTFIELIERVKQTALGAFKHQSLPYEELVAELAATRDSDRRSLVDVMFVMEEGLEGSLEMAGLRASEEKLHSGTAKYDLMMALRDRDGAFEGTLEYSADLFDETTVSRIALSYQRLVEAALADPEQRVEELALLSDSDRQRLLLEWNDTEKPGPDWRNIRQVFEEQESHTPDSIAAIFEETHLSYRELNSRANQLAHYLREAGVGGETLVGICLERSLEVAIHILSVFKAGGAYLPLDPAYPKARLSFMLEDAGVRVLLTEPHLMERLPAFFGTVVCPNADREIIEKQPRDNPGEMGSAGSLAYVIYTSGSTGRPKGVGLPHVALTNLIGWHSANLLSKARTLQFASMSFDVSFYEMFVTWASCGTLLIVPEQHRSDILRLARFVSDHRVEKAVLPVVTLQQLAEERSFRRRGLTSLREVITTGEQLRITSPVVEFFSDLQACSLHNHYGPSESHVATAESLDRDPYSWQAAPPIGRPITNTRIFLLGRHATLTPAGSIGEVHIGGAGLARGYLNRPDLTAERFVPNPFARSEGDRLYRTGDLGRYAGDGRIVFIGRRDHQVKVRGFRVELGEVESVLARHPALRGAAVVTRDDNYGGRRLIAYVATERRREITGEGLRAYLNERLPDHMVPSSFIIMENLPVTHNGKIDRAALIERNHRVAEVQEDLIPARTPAEELAARIWSEALGVEVIGVNSNFFALGGHSVLAMQIVMMLREIFRVELPVRSLFERPTVGGLVEVLSNLWGGREIVEEIAWTFLQVERLPDESLGQILASRRFGSAS